ncbi:ROK family protein [Bifidobacterium sp.]|uniref:ROK family transcriptional regulator n=1 Tax=Bifidobacterium sp. TaxID=41200 RepID=UPI0039EC82B7
MPASQIHRHQSQRLVSKDVRNHNLGLVLTELARNPGVSRSYLANATGLTHGALTLLIRELEEYGLVRPSDSPEIRSREPGRKKQLLALADRTYAIAAIELRNESVKLTCESISGKRIVEREYAEDFHNRPVDSFAQYVALRIFELMGMVQRLGFRSLPIVGVAVPAPGFEGNDPLHAAIDFGRGTVPLGKEIIEHLHAFQSDMAMPKIIVFNDANTALWAEYRHLCNLEPANAPSTVLYLKSDIGIGGSAIVQGHIFNGSRGTAIEPGHFQIDPHGRSCACGRVGCLVTVADPSLLLERAHLGDVDRSKGRSHALSTLMAQDREGIPLAHRTLIAADRSIIQVLSNIIVLLTPDCIVLGGYLCDRVEEISRLDEPSLRCIGYRGHRGRQAILPSFYRQDAVTVGALMRLRSCILWNAGLIANDLPWSWSEE